MTRIPAYDEMRDDLLGRIERLNEKNRALEAKNADLEARLAAVHRHANLTRDRGLLDLLYEPDPIDLPTALSLAGWEEDDCTYLDDKLADGTVMVIRRKKEADDEVD